MRVLACFVLSAALFAQGPSASSGKDSSPARPEAGGSINPENGGSIGIGAPMRHSALTVTVNQSLILDQPAGIRRISIASGDIAEAAAASSQEILLNGKSPGDTTLLVWDAKGNRQAYEVHVLANSTKLDAVTQELAVEAGPKVSLTLGDGTVFLNGTVKDSIAADRANAIAATLGKVVNLLRVEVPPGDPQILLKVRFADVDRTAALQLGFNLYTMDPYKGLGSSTTGQFGTVPIWNYSQQGSAHSVAFTLSNLLNLSYFNPEIDMGAILQDLQAKNVLQILAEPNLLTTSGRSASFLAGGEFPFPTLQGGAAGVGQITIQFKEFGIRLNFLPTVTPRGTIHLVVTPEVSSLDYSNGLTVSGYTIPGLSTRRVQTEVELENGQSFVIAGLLDNEVTEQLNKIPGVGDIPIIGKLFQSKSVNKTNSELLVTVTPELVGPIPAGIPAPSLKFPKPFLEGSSKSAPQNPGPSVTGPAPALPKASTVPVEQLKNFAPATSLPSSPGVAPLLGIQPVLTIQPIQQPAQAPGAQPAAPPPNN
ncbi:MAG: pilus assembly protein N-terminal domain-containing protein [Acidobacteriaceae bacterium]|nr:pilus assembly protein N-terminal domain-containing protein [Acidobacteriaceae bacterium]